MRSLVSLNNLGFYVNSATVFGGGTVDANYPVSNLLDLVQTTKVSRIAPVAGATSLDFSLSTPLGASFFALIGHNQVSPAQMRVIGYSGAHAAGSVIYDSGTLSIWPSSGPMANFQSIRPLLITTPTAILSLIVHFGGLVGTFLEIGSIFLGEYVELPGVGPGKQFGFTNRLTPIDIVGGGADPPAPEFLPRTLSADLPFVALGFDANRMQDFQRFNGTSQPMVYIEDYDDPSTWARRSMVCTNQDLPAAMGARYRHDKISLRLREHRR